MKGALAAAMLAVAAAAALGLRGDVIVTAVADEEVASLGTEAVLERVAPTRRSSCEPTELQVAIAHRGFAGFEIETHGVAAHGSRPDLGVDAIAKMGPSSSRSTELDGGCSAGARHPLVGTGSLHASLIEGGQEFSSYPARCLLTGERRTLPGEPLASRARAARRRRRRGAAAARLARAVRGRPAHELVRARREPPAGAERRSASRSGPTPRWSQRPGSRRVLYGPVGEGAHAAVEWVDLDSLERVPRRRTRRSRQPSAE